MIAEIQRPGIFSPLMGHRAQYFFPRPQDPEHDEDLTEFAFIIPHTVGAWIDDAWGRKRRISEMARAYSIGKDRLSSHIFTGLQFVGTMDLADRVSNGLRESTLWDNRDNSRTSKFGIVLTEAFNNPLFSHHNHEHDRRVELITEAMMLNVGELRHGILIENAGGRRTKSIFPWIDSSLLYAYWHDVDQILTLQRNVMEKRNTDKTKLPVKTGHALAAAVMMLALHKRYTFEGKVNTHRAWQKCAGVAAMIMMHEPPERLTKRLTANELAYKIAPNGKELLHGEDLQKAYNEDRLDVFSLAPSQLLELLRNLKKQGGFISDGDEKSYGMHPYFEEEYTTELTALANNNDPLIRDMTNELRLSFNMAAETAVRADVVDMVAPPVESILRTLDTERKEVRPFLRRNENTNIPDLLELILHGPGDLPPESDSDVRRILWEYAHAELISPDTVIAKNRYVQDLNRENAIMGLLAFYDIGGQILRGEYAALDEIFKQRVRMLGGKIHRRAFGSFQSVLFQLANKNRSDYENRLHQKLLRSGKIGLNDDYTEGIRRLERQKEKIIAGLQKKRPESGYNNDDLTFFEDLVNEVLREVCAQYGLKVKDIDDKKLAKYRSRLKKRLYPSSIPYDTWDSLGKWPPSTLVASIREINLQQIHELYEKLLEEPAV